MGARTAAEPFRADDFREEDRGYKIDGQPSPCRLWARGKTKAGYGSMRLEGHGAYPHRVAAALASGAVPPGYDVHHKCRQRNCTHPDHLQIVLPAENVRDGALAKLTTEQVAEIKSRVEAGERQAALAREFGVCASTVSKLVRARPKLRRERVVLTDEQVLDIWISRRDGESLRSIGERHGVDPNYVIAVMHRCPTRPKLRGKARDVLRALVEPAESLVWTRLDEPLMPVDRFDAAATLGPRGPLDPRTRALAFRAWVQGFPIGEAGREYALRESSAARLLYDAAGAVAADLWPNVWRAAR